MKRTILSIVLFLGCVAVSAGQEIPAPPDSKNDSIEELRAQMKELRQESRELREQLEIMRQQLDLIRGAQTTAPDAPVSSTSNSEPQVDSRVPALVEQQQLLNAKIEDQYQTKVESGSKYRLRLSGIALLNANSTRGAVNDLDVPRFAVAQRPGDSNGSFSASARQSRVNLSLSGPDWKGATAEGDLSFDFWGGFPSASEGVSTGLVRLRTAKLTLDWTKASIIAGQDIPFFSPRSPNSLASSAYPPFASAGNIWTWTPQVEVERRFATSEQSTFSLQAGILDPFTGELPSEYDRLPTAGERSRVPAYAMHFGWGQNGDRVTGIGIGGYYSRQNWGFNRSVDAWVVTSDWDIPLVKWWSLSGEFYRGRSMGGLGANASGSVLFTGDPTVPGTGVLPLNNIGGWSQLTFAPVERISFNGAYGADQPFHRGLSALLNQGLTVGSPISRNASGFVNAIYQPRSNLLFSVEYRRLWTYGFHDPRRTADHISFTSGIVF